MVRYGRGKASKQGASVDESVSGEWLAGGKRRRKWRDQLRDRTMDNGDVKNAVNRQ